MRERNKMVQQTFTDMEYDIVRLYDKCYGDTLSSM